MRIEVLQMYCCASLLHCHVHQQANENHSLYNSEVSGNHPLLLPDWTKGDVLVAYTDISGFVIG